MDRPLTRRLLAAAAWAVVVVVGAAGASAYAPFRLGRPGSAALVYILASAAVLAGGGAWLWASLLSRRQRDRGPAGGSSWSMSPRRMFPGAMVLFALVGLFGISRANLGVGSLPEVADGQDRGPGREGHPLEIWDTRDRAVRAEGREDDLSLPVFDSRPVTLAAALLVVLLGGAAMAWWLGKRPGAGAVMPADPVDADVARDSVLRSIEAMLSDPDPNTAVIGAYARLLEGLAAAGVPRRDFEAPLEHLARALTQLRVRPGPIQRLVTLFEVARFSTRALTARDREAALDALQQVASDLGRGALVVSAPTPPSPSRAGS